RFGFALKQHLFGVGRDQCKGFGQDRFREGNGDFGVRWSVANLIGANEDFIGPSGESQEIENEAEIDPRSWLHDALILWASLEQVIHPYESVTLSLKIIQQFGESRMEFVRPFRSRPEVQQ